MSDEPRDPALETVLGALADAVRESLFVAMPGTIVSYDSGTRSASVQPSLQRSHINETDTKVPQVLPVLNDVPVMMIGTAALRIKFPLAKGDPVLLVFCGQSLDVWKRRSGVNSDADDRRHDLTDAIAIPGLVPFGDASESSPLIEFTGSEIHVGGSGSLVTQLQFLNHTHATAATGSPSPPIALSPTPALVGTSVIKGA
jgi:Phage protein Gp138 N-terminal domain